MGKAIIIAGIEKTEFQGLIDFLSNQQLRIDFIDTPSGLKEFVTQRKDNILLMDLDGFPVDERFCRDLKREDPTICIMGLSKSSFHPDLEEAISRHMYACLKKPVDTEEISYLLKSVFNSTEQ